MTYDMTFYAVLSHFVKCCDSRVQVPLNCPKKRGGEIQPILTVPVFRHFFLLNIAFLWEMILFNLSEGPLILPRVLRKF